MAPPQQPAEPNQPPKRDPNPLMVPTVGLGNNQVMFSTINSDNDSILLFLTTHIFLLF